MPLRAPVRAVNSVCNDGCANDMRIIVITGPSGFEPETPGLEGQCYILSKLRAHCKLLIDELNLNFT